MYVCGAESLCWHLKLTQHCKSAIFQFLKVGGKNKTPRLAQAQKRHTDQWNRRESPEINPHTYGQLIYNKWGKNIQWRKDCLFSKWFREHETSTCRIIKSEHSLIPDTKVNSKWIKELHVRLDTIKLPEENISRTVFDINRSGDFFRSVSQSKGNQSKNEQMGFN